jgi:transcription initiation factor IIE alpha subunit
MNILSKLLKKEQRSCLICEKSLGKNFAEVKYSYHDGVGSAFICEKCGDEIEKNRMEQEGNDDIAV